MNLWTFAIKKDTVFLVALHTSLKAFHFNTRNVPCSTEEFGGVNKFNKSLDLK